MKRPRSQSAAEEEATPAAASARAETHSEPDREPEILKPKAATPAQDIELVLGAVERLRTEQLRRDADPSRPRSLKELAAVQAAMSSNSTASASNSVSSLVSAASSTSSVALGTEVQEFTEEQVRQRIEETFISKALEILGGHGLSYTVPVRSSANQMYVPELDRIVLKDNSSERSMMNLSTARKTALTTRILQLVHQVVSREIHITKRDLFYTDVRLFEQQKESDVILEDIACMLGCTRTSLNVVASEKGVVVGRVSFREAGDYIDCTRMGVGGKAIPPLTDRITEIQGDARFILLVEKDAAFLRLSEDRFYNQYPCIIITAKGQPDIATRMFLKKVKSALNIPILGLMDSDPYGLKILSVYMSGSKNMSYDSASLTVSDIKWLGVRPSDLDSFNIPKECRLEMTEADIETGKQLLKEDFIQKNEDWVNELKIMLARKEKAEIQALSNFGFQYLTQTYLPMKLRKGDWI